MEKITIKKITRSDFEIILHVIFDMLDFQAATYSLLKLDMLMRYELLFKVYQRNSRKLTPNANKRYNFIVTRGEAAAIVLSFPIGKSASLDQLLLPIHQKLA